MANGLLIIKIYSAFPRPRRNRIKDNQKFKIQLELIQDGGFSIMVDEC